MQNIKIKKLLIGTNNKGKLKEIRNLLPKYIKTLSSSDLKIKSPKENGKTFAWLPSIIATQEFVVPKSIPIILLIYV